MPRSHDRMSFVIPHTGLSYDPLSTDWDFLLPLELADDEIGHRALDQLPGHAPRDRPLPMISGFIALIKVFLCIVDLLHKAFPGPPQAYHLSSGTLVPLLLDNDERQKPKFQGSIPTLDSLFHVMTRLNTTLSNLPPELRMPRRRGSPATYDAERGALPAVSPQFDIMRANVHITSIYLQSMILEMCLDKVELSDHGARAGSQGTSPASDPATPDTSAREQLWQLKESVARELLDVVHYCSAWTLESNGSSMVSCRRSLVWTVLWQPIVLTRNRLSRFERLQPRCWNAARARAFSAMSNDAAASISRSLSRYWQTWTTHRDLWLVSDDICLFLCAL